MLLLVKRDKIGVRKMIMDTSVWINKLEKEKVSLSGIQKEELVFSPFWEDFKLRFCWSSNAMEGSTLDLDETIDVLLYDEVRSGHTYQEYTDAKNLYEAINKKISTHKIEITEEWIKQSNEIIMNAARGYRTKDVYVGTLAEATYYPPHYREVPKLMEELLNEVNIENRNLAELFSGIAECHIRFERIHPFSDGNGRTGRMILNQQLINNDLLPIAIDKTSKYRQAFREYEKNGDTSLLVYLICSKELEAINRVTDLKSRAYGIGREEHSPDKRKKVRKKNKGI